MFYRPAHAATGEMWDTWLYWHEGTHYLYYLARSGEQWDNISMATSADGVHWEERGPILHMSDGVTWMGTGSVWEAPGPGGWGSSVGPGQFQMNFSEWRGPRQTIFFAASGDLVTWERLEASCEFAQDERWYEREGRWDCIWTVPRSEGGLYGYWTATPRHGTAGRFGFGQSADGVTWEALPPPAVHGAGEGEVGAVEVIDGRYYMMFGTGGRMVTLVADQPAGPFHLVPCNSQLLGGHTYFSRFYPSPDGLLANHHSIARDGRVFMGLLKEAAVDGEGVLRLGWWSGNERLKGERTRRDLTWVAEPKSPIHFASAALDVTGGSIVECELALPRGAYAARRGLYVECAGEDDLTVLLDDRGRAEYVRTGRDGGSEAVDWRTDREVRSGAVVQVRLLLQHELTELYLDDVLIECVSLPGVATGRMGLVHGGQTDATEEVTVWC